MLDTMTDSSNSKSRSILSKIFFRNISRPDGSLNINKEKSANTQHVEEYQEMLGLDDDGNYGSHNDADINLKRKSLTKNPESKTCRIFGRPLGEDH